MIDNLRVAKKTTVCTLPEEYELSTQLQGYRGDWIDLTAKVTGLDAYGTIATRSSEITRVMKDEKNKFRTLQEARSKTLLAACAEAEMRNNCLRMFRGRSYDKKLEFV